MENSSVEEKKPLTKEDYHKTFVCNGCGRKSCEETYIGGVHIIQCVGCGGMYNYDIYFKLRIIATPDDDPEEENAQCSFT